MPIVASQKRCSKCPPSHAVRRRRYWHIAVTVIEWSILIHSVRHFVYQKQHTSQLRHHKVRAVQLWWLNLIIDLATVSIIHVQKNSKYQNNHIFWRKNYADSCQLNN